MKTIVVNIPKQTVTINNHTDSFIEAGLSGLSDQVKIEHILNTWCTDGSQFEIIFVL